MNIEDAINIRQLPNGVWVPSEDHDASNHIARLGLVWEPHFQKFPYDLHGGDQVIDIGAWAGDSTRAFLNAGCEVHAFEPQLDSFACLCLNCPESNNYNLAVGKCGETYGLAQTGGNTGGRMLQVGKKKIIRLDAFGFNPKLIKIDVEGYEVYALEGAQATISRNSPIIQIEINKFALESFGFKKDAIDNWLKDAGYKRKEILAAANNDLFEALYTR